MDKCKHRLPCGWCDRRNEKCEIEYGGHIAKEIPVSRLDTPIYDKLESCTHQWEYIGMDSVGIQYRCRLCGETKTEYSLNYSTKISSNNSAL